MNGNLRRIRETINLYPPFFWEALIARHDDGKLIDLPTHHEETGKLIEEFKMLDQPPYSGLSEKIKLLLREVMEHHSNLGIVFVGDSSLLNVKETFDCPRVRELLIRPDQSLDLGTARMFFSTSRGLHLSGRVRSRTQRHFDQFPGRGLLPDRQ